jgi:hypothetical protein
VILRDQALEVRVVDGRPHVARNLRHYASGTRLRPYGSGPSVSAYAGDEAIDRKRADADPCSFKS